MKVKLLTERQRRCLERAWSRRGARVEKKFQDRKRYLAARTAALQVTVNECNSMMSKIRDAIFKDIGVLLAVGDGSDAAASAEPGLNIAETPTTISSTLSGAQVERLLQQAMATTEVLKELQCRSKLQLAHLQDAYQACLAADAEGISRSQEQADKKVLECMEEASLIRLNNSLVLIAARVVESEGLRHKPSTILTWLREFQTLGGFKRDGRGVHEREWILNEEDLKSQLLSWLKAQKRVSTKKTRDYVNTVLLKDEGFEQLSRYGLNLPISSTTVHSWMIKLDCKYDRVGQSYYTDGHERADVVKNRKEYSYCMARREHALRQPCWARAEWEPLTSEEKSELDALVENQDPRAPEVFRFQDEGNGKEWVEFHVDFLGGKSNDKHDALRNEMGPEGGTLSKRFDAAAAAPCKFRHDPDVCKCDKMIYHIGQDESIYRAYAREGNEWKIQGVSGLRKKTEGPGEMVSAFQDEIRGFGFPLTQLELERVNLFRQRFKRPALKTSPGLRFLLHGKNREGFWGFKEFEEQVVDVMDCFDVLYSDCQLMIEVDHSAGHAKFREGGLHVGHMDVKYGGARKPMRDTIMTEGCVGSGEAKMYFNGGKWSTQFVEGVTEKTVDLKLRVGDTQHMAFEEGAPPPFYACEALPHTSQKKKNSRGKEVVTHEAYVGKAKGMRQVLWERGLFVEGMSASADAPAEKRMDEIISSLPDFKNEKSALQHTVEGRGHILLLSPKYHPEVAGVGIEYSWGMSKLKFRREINDEVPKHLHDNIVKSMCRERILTLGRLRRFARRSRDYCRAYVAHENGGAIESKDKIEQMRKIAKAHRNIIDMEPGFIDKQ